MEVEKTLTNPHPLAAPLIFFFILTLQLLSRFIEYLRKRGSKNAEQVQLRKEVKRILKEAASFSAPSTFAQAAKLRRMAAAKEKELVKIQEQQNKESEGTYASAISALRTLKVLGYLVLSWWFWGVPVAIVSQQLLQPLGKVFSWKAGDAPPGLVMVGIVPWLIMTTRVSKLICQKLRK